MQECTYGECSHVILYNAITPMTCRVVSGKSAAAFRLVVLLDGQSFLYRAWPSSENIFNIDIYITNSKVKSVVAYVQLSFVF